MPRHAQRHHSAGPGTPDDLGRLLDTERKLSSLLQAAREKGERIVADARAEAERSEAAAAANLARAEASLKEQQALEQAQKLDVLREQTRARVQQLESVSEVDLERLVSGVLDALLSDTGEAP